MTFATAAPFCPTRLLSSRDPAIPNRTDNEQNRKAVTFARALCRPHMNASTSSYPLIYWTHWARIATSHSCHLIAKNRAAALSFISMGTLSECEIYARLQNGEPDGNVVTHRIRRYEYFNSWQARTCAAYAACPQRAQSRISNRTLSPLDERAARTGFLGAHSSIDA